MRVKRLEIQGFKSFKDKTVLHFDEGITGIVGPNGCGKSNIVDAFFWVMGEQSYKHMRGTGSDDLIFNGSSKYSPLGMAEATLVLETDFTDSENQPAGATARDIPLHLRSKEVAVTRRLYREGEGEYLINGVTARLKDIQELFMDTGVGAKGYSVIEQGQIGKIVNAKPEDRRLLIEEAAGIAKYKARKKESLRKMEATQGNLSRLNDVIQEIERSLGSLERQAQKARQYKKYKDELLDKEMTWGRRRAMVFRQKLDSLCKDKEALEQELVGLRAELQVAENSIETDRVDQVTDTKIAEELQARIQQLSDELTRDRSALDLSRRRQGDLSSQLEALAVERGELEQSIAAEKLRLEERQLAAETSDEEFQAASGRASEADDQTRQARTETENSRRELESTQRELMNGVTRASDLTSRAASLASRAESAREQADKLAQQAQAHADKLKSLREESQAAQSASTGLKAKRESLQTEKREQSAQVQTQEQNLRSLERIQNESQKQLTQLRSRQQSLEELASAYEGFGDGPKAVLDWAKSQGSSTRFSALADALDVPSGYEVALEGWLENKIESLVADDSELALQAVDHLREAKQGRASIFVGTGPTANVDLTRAKSALSGSGFEVLGNLDEQIKIQSSASALARQSAAKLIGGVVLVQTMQPLAAFLADGGLKKLEGASVLSLDGSSLDSAGTFRGGSASDSAASHLKRKQAIADLSRQVADAEARQQDAERNTQETKNTLDLARARLQTLQTDLQAVEIEAAAFERDVHQSGRTLREAESQAEHFEREISQMRGEADRAAADRAEAESQLESIVGSRSDLEAKIENLKGSTASLETELRSLEECLQVLRVSEAQLRERAVSLKRELEASNTLIRDRERRMADVVRTLDRASNEKAQFTGGEFNLETHIEELTARLGTSREELAVVKDRLEQSGAKLNLALERIKELHKIGDKKTGETNSLALEVEKLSGDLSHLTQNLEEKYGPGCLEKPVTSPIQEEMNEPVVTAEMTAEEELALGEEVERLRERIRRLGEVNVMAIEEYEVGKKRYDYLLTERKDLEHSIENLMEAIEHINKTSEERFRRAFDAIADRFERLFPIIFGGGQAKLSLVYPEGSSEILEAGVDILAQPPGKKIVNIGLLSGGEKALTAVSLIFAIFMVKPSPFCVLDEVDAPLDDANIGKFNALLKEMSAKSQFILITHNKKSMELNDTLYGVTMEEPGVSKMVSIRMQ